MELMTFFHVFRDQLLGSYCGDSFTVNFHLDVPSSSAPVSNMTSYCSVDGKLGIFVGSLLLNRLHNLPSALELLLPQADPVVAT